MNVLQRQQRQPSSGETETSWLLKPTPPPALLRVAFQQPPAMGLPKQRRDAAAVYAIPSASGHCTVPARNYTGAKMVKKWALGWGGGAHVKSRK